MILSKRQGSSLENDVDFPFSDHLHYSFDKEHGKIKLTNGGKKGKRLQPYRNDPISINEYFQIRESSDVLLNILMALFTCHHHHRQKHQRVSSKLQIQFGNFLESTSCEVFPAAYDIELQVDKKRDNTFPVRFLEGKPEKGGYG